MWRTHVLKSRPICRGGSTFGDGGGGSDDAGPGVLPQKILKSRCSEMRFQANPDDIKSLVTRLIYTTQILRPGGQLLVKTKKNQRLDDWKSPVQWTLVWPEMNQRKSWKNNEITYFRYLCRNTSGCWELFFTPKNAIFKKCHLGRQWSPRSWLKSS
jgi:hypothetical protein